MLIHICLWLDWKQKQEASQPPALLSHVLLDDDRGLLNDV